MWTEAGRRWRGNRRYGVTSTSNVSTFRYNITMGGCELFIPDFNGVGIGATPPGDIFDLTPGK